MKANIKTEKGEVIIDTDVIAKYAGAVAVECFGVVGMDIRLNDLGSFVSSASRQSMIYIINRDTQVILCSEEDVVGNHGASIGRLDEDLLFYLQSRGIDSEAATELMAKARVDAIIRRIPDGQLRAALLKED